MYFSAGSWLPGQTQWARSLIRVPSAQSPGPPSGPLGQVMPISNSLFGSPRAVVPARNFGKTSTLPGAWESLNPTGRTWASAGIASVSAISATSATRPHVLVCIQVLLLLAATPLDVMVLLHARVPDGRPPAIRSTRPRGRGSGVPGQGSLPTPPTGHMPAWEHSGWARL